MLISSISEENKSRFPHFCEMLHVHGLDKGAVGWLIEMLIKASDTGKKNAGSGVSKYTNLRPEL